jgi:c-di-GMP-binding flagellar brake protein YcgR
LNPQGSEAGLRNILYKINTMSEQNPAQYNGVERRRFRRVKINLEVVYREDDTLDLRIRAGSQEHRASMLDISEAGMAFLTDVNIPLWTLLRIRFNMEDAKETGINFYGTEDVKAKVLHVTKVSGGNFRIGVHFYDLSRSERVRIGNFVAIIEKRAS